MGGMLHGPAGQTRQITLGPEPASEVAAAGAGVTGLRIDDRAVINPRTAPPGIIDYGGAHGGTAEYLLIENASAGRSVAVSPAIMPFGVASRPTEFYEVGRQLAQHAGRFAKLINHRFPFTEVHDAFQLALTPGAAEKVVVTVGD